MKQQSRLIPGIIYSCPLILENNLRIMGKTQSEVVSECTYPILTFKYTVITVKSKIQLTKLMHHFFVAHTDTNNLTQ